MGPMAQKKHGFHCFFGSPRNKRSFMTLPGPSKGWCLNPKELFSGTPYHPFGTPWRVQVLISQVFLVPLCMKPPKVTNPTLLIEVPVVWEGLVHDDSPSTGHRVHDLKSFSVVLSTNPFEKYESIKLDHLPTKDRGKNV